MSFLEKIKLPYRNETAFGFLVLCVFLVPLAFSQYANENYEIVKYGLFILFTGAALIGIVCNFRSRELKFSYNKKLYILLASFIFWAAISTAFSLNILHGIFGFYYRLTNGMVFFLCFSIFLILLLNLADEGKLEYLFKILVLDGLIVALVGFASAFNFIIYGGPDIDGFFRGPSLLGNADYSAMFLACIFPFAIYFFIKAKSFAPKIYYLICAFWIIFELFILASRGSLLGIGFGLAVILILLIIYRFPKKILFTILGTIFILGLFGNMVIFTSRPQAVSSVVGNVVDANTSLRLEVWKISLEGILKNPFFGSGPGNYPLFFERSRPESIPGEMNVFDDAHNLYLHLGVTGGLPLVLIFLFIIILSFYYGLSNLKKDGILLNLFVIGSLVSWLVSVSFNPVPIPMYLLLAVLISALFLKNLNRNFVKLNIFPAYILMLAGCILCVFAVMVITSDLFFGASIRDYNNQDYGMAYNNALWAERFNPSNEWISQYLIKSAIHLGYDRSKIDSDIKHMQTLRKGESDSYVISSDCYYLLYQLKGNENDLALATSYMAKALAIDPYFAERYGEMALYQYQAGDFYSAKFSLFRELGLTQQDFSAWILLAKVYQQQGNKTATIFALNKGFYLHPESAELKYIIYLAKRVSDIKQVSIPVTSPAI